MATTASRIYTIELTSLLVEETLVEAPPELPYSTSEPAFVVAPDLRVTVWNQALEQLTGVAAQAALGRPCHQVMAAIASGDPPASCGVTCPLMAGRPHGRPPERAGFLVETPAGPRQAELATIRVDADALLHLVELVPGGARPARPRRSQ
jgi:PAS domain-containing protein